MLIQCLPKNDGFSKVMLINSEFAVRKVPLMRAFHFVLH